MFNHYITTHTMTSEFIPRSMSMMSASMNDFVRNRFRLETQGSATAGPGQITSVVLPESALLHLPSFRFFYDVTTTSATQGSATVYGRLPGDAASALIQKVEVFIGGVQIMSGTDQYNTICKVLKLAEGSLPRDQSVDRALSHGAITSADAVESEQLCLQEWRGFLGESCEWLPTDICGAVTVKITWAQPNVLVPKENGVSLGDNLSADGKTAASSLTYSISNMYFTVDSAQPPLAYNQALRERLQQSDIKINYKDYATFHQAGVGSSFSHRFGVSSASIDKIYGVVRDTNYLDTGVKSYDLTDSAVSIGDTHVANAFRFRTFENGNNFRYQWSVNNVSAPQYLARSLEALADLHYTSNKLGATAQGSLVSNRLWFRDALGVVTLQLNCPTEMGHSIRSGYNSKGLSSQLVLKQQGMTTPQAVADTGETADRTSTVITEMTQVLCLGLGRQISVTY